MDLGNGMEQMPRVTPPASADVDAAREALDAAATTGIEYLRRRDAFEAAVRAAALDEARAAVETLAVPSYMAGDLVIRNDALAAIDALREDADAR